MNCCMDALVCPATTDIPRHDSVNICVAGLWIGHQESGSRHYLTGLAIAAFEHVAQHPKQCRIAIDINLVHHPIYFEFEAHPVSPGIALVCMSFLLVGLWR